MIRQKSNGGTEITTLPRLWDFQDRKSKKAAPRDGLLDRMAGELGLEPRMTVPKTVVLPLHHSPPFPVNRWVAVRPGDVW